ncbi:MAG: hypothetical protein COB04_00105 [Gammaproteobacteria bacterium]|nr:MAG: hypothetical protein COB04_00105 [Gammaproteobacteria bacterium]
MTQLVAQDLFNDICRFTDSLQGIEQRKFLGQSSLVANGSLFVLVTRECRIALHLKELDIEDRLNVPKESCIWKTGGRLMINWILLPEEFHSQEENLTEWLKLGYEYACSRSNAGNCGASKLH